MQCSETPKPKSPYLRALTSFLRDLQSVATGLICLKRLPKSFQQPSPRSCCISILGRFTTQNNDLIDRVVLLERLDFLGSRLLSHTSTVYWLWGFSRAVACAAIANHGMAARPCRRSSHNMAKQPSLLHRGCGESMGQFRSTCQFLCTLRPPKP